MSQDSAGYKKKGIKIPLICENQNLRYNDKRIKISVTAKVQQLFELTK